jgi:DNA-binding NarL/FixJ family response regulator
VSNISVIVADGQFLVRIGVRHLLQNRGGIQLLGEAENEAKLWSLMNVKPADVIILDYNQPISFSKETIKKIKSNYPTTGILIISADNERDSIYEVLEEGVTCFLTKSCKELEIIEGIEAAATKKRFFCRKVMDYIFERSFSKTDPSLEPLPLTDREVEIVKLAAQGLIAKEIASELHITTHTVYTHRKNIMRKLKINTSTELVLYAVNKGLVN